MSSYELAVKRLVKYLGLTGCNAQDKGRNKANTAQIVGIKRLQPFPTIKRRRIYYLVWDDSTRKPSRVASSKAFSSN